MATQNTQRTRSAFSLVELSIVLVILGLLVGGVLSGQALIRASELRTVTKEFDSYRTAMNSFRDKYFALPGDISNANSFWPSTSPGSGNGYVENAPMSTINEISMFWTHLTLASLIEGSYAPRGGTTGFTAGTNNPRSKMGNAGWNIFSVGTVQADGTTNGVSGTLAPNTERLYANSYGHVLMLGQGTNVRAQNGVLKSEEAWNIDTKLDDGKPDTGILTTYESQGSATAGSGCGNQNGATTAIPASSYDLANTSATACALVFKTGY